MTAQRLKARSFGRWGEALAILSLRLRGWRIVARGHVTGRGSGAGEVDIIACRGRVLAFIEVKARPTRAQAAAAISAQQQARIARAAAAYLARHPHYAGHVVRFDALLVVPWRWPYHLFDAWRLDR